MDGRRYAKVGAVAEVARLIGESVRLGRLWFYSCAGRPCCGVLARCLTPVGGRLLRCCCRPGPE